MHNSIAHQPRVVQLRRGLQAWWQPVAGGGGHLPGSDFRIYREEPDSGVYVLTQQGLKVPFTAFRSVGSSFVSAAAHPFHPYAIPFTSALELRLGAVVDPSTGLLAVVDARLYRVAEDTGEFTATRAGLTIPPGALEEVGRVFHELADELELPA